MLTPLDEVVLPPFWYHVLTSYVGHSHVVKVRDSMKLRMRIGSSITSLVLAATGLVGVNSASAGDPAFACVSVNADTCTVTIALTSNMNEQVSSSMPDTQPWFMSAAAGKGPYGITGPGNDQTTWDGVAGALQGSSWAAILTTNANEPAGSQAVLTFVHVSSTTTTTLAAQPYHSISESYPLRVAVGSIARVTATVSPLPGKGHLVLLRKSGANWLSVATFVYSVPSKKWVALLRWHFPKHAKETFRLLATAAPGLSATFGGTFKITTL